MGAVTQALINPLADASSRRDAPLRPLCVDAIGLPRACKSFRIGLVVKAKAEEPFGVISCTSADVMFFLCHP